MLLTLIPLGQHLAKIKRQHYKTKVLENKWVNIIEDDYICCNVPPHLIRTLGQFWNIVCTFGGEASNLRLKAMNVMCFPADRTIIW